MSHQGWDQTTRRAQSLSSQPRDTPIMTGWALCLPTAWAAAWHTANSEFFAA